MTKSYYCPSLVEEGTEEDAGLDVGMVQSFGFLGKREPLNVLSKGLALPLLYFKSFRCLKSVGEEGKEKRARCEKSSRGSGEGEDKKRGLI